MRFADVIGHSELKSALARGVDSHRVSHAQLFTGKAGYGTLPLALAYAQYVNCTARIAGDSCGVCPSCRKISELAHPDLHFVFPVNSASKGGGSQKPLSDAFLPQWRELFASTGGYFTEQKWYSAINIENQQGVITRNEADEIIRKLSFKSFEAAYKIMIVWLPERMRQEAANVLLKILEEPWERTLFLLVSEAPQMLLPTILSRTQQVAVGPIAEADMIEYACSTLAMESGKAQEATRLAGGDVIYLRNMTEQGDESDSDRYFELFATLMRLSYNDRHMELLDWGDSVASLGRERQKRFLQYCVAMLRESYMLNAGMEKITTLKGPELEFGRRFSPFIDNNNIEALVSEMELAIAQISQNGNPGIIFPHLALAVSKLIAAR